MKQQVPQKGGGRGSPGQMRVTAAEEGVSSSENEGRQAWGSRGYTEAGDDALWEGLSLLE